MDSTDIKNKLVLDPAQYPKIAEALSKKEAGDKVTLEIEAALDECGDKVICLSIEEAEISQDATPDDEAAEDAAGTEGEGEGAGEEDAAESESPAVKLFKGKAKQKADAEQE